MKTPSLTALTFVLAASAASAAPPDHCANLAALETRELMFAAFPPDAAGRPYANRELGFENGQWTRYTINGSITIGQSQHDIFRRALQLHCSRLAAEKAEAARSERVLAAQAAIRAEPRANPPVDPRKTAPKVSASIGERLAGFVDSMKPTAPQDVVAGAETTTNCANVRAQVETCDDGSAGAGNLPTDFKCRKARADLRALCR